MSRAFPRRALAAMGLLFVTIGALEAMVRVDDWAQFGVPLAAPAIGIEELAVVDSLGFHARSGSTYRQYHVNALGFRGPEVSSDELTRPLVVTAGASETFGLYEGAGREWPRQLSDSLASCMPKLLVLNAAFAGMALPTVRQDFERRLRKFSPRVVVYYPTPMQYLYSDPPGPAAPFMGPIPPLSTLRSRALPRFRDAAKRSLPAGLLDALRRWDTQKRRGDGKIIAKSTVDTTRLSLFERDLRSLVGVYRAAGATPILFVHANRFSETASAEAKRYLTAWERFYPNYTGAALVAFDAAAAQRIQRVGQDSGVVVIDPRTMLHASPSNFFDYAHFTDSGAAIVGGLAARAVRDVLCAPASPGQPAPTAHAH